MSEDVEWLVDRKAVLALAGLRANDAKRVSPYADTILTALLMQVSEYWVEQPNEDAASVVSATAPLLLPGTRFHLNLTAARKAILASSVGIVVHACLLSKLSLLDLVATLTSTGVATMLGQLTRLSDEQRLVIQAILHLKRTSSAGFWPTASAIATFLGWPTKRTTTVLNSMSQTVLKHAGSTWHVVL